MVIRIECANLSKFLLLQLTFGNICRSWWLQVARAVRFYVSVYYMAGIKKTRVRRTWHTLVDLYRLVLLLLQ